MNTKQTTLQQDLGILASDLVTAGNHEGAALVTAAVNAMAAPANMPASDAALEVETRLELLRINVRELQSLIAAPQQPVAASSSEEALCQHIQDMVDRLNNIATSGSTFQFKRGGLHYTKDWCMKGAQSDGDGCISAGCVPTNQPVQANGIQELFCDEEDSFNIDASKPFCRFVRHEDSGDASVGVPSVSYWALSHDQSGTALQDMISGAVQAAPFPACAAEEDAALTILALLCTRMGIDQSLPANERAGKLSEMLTAQAKALTDDQIGMREVANALKIHAEQCRGSLDPNVLINMIDAAEIILAASQPSAPADVAQKNGDLIDWDRISKAAKQACNEYGQWMPERWLQLFVNAYNRKKS